MTADLTQPHTCNLCTTSYHVDCIELEEGNVAAVRGRVKEAWNPPTLKVHTVGLTRQSGLTCYLLSWPRTPRLPVEQRTQDGLETLNVRGPRRHLP